ncbi:unnamed protein product [Amoebophrya sp. A120]|nr:unnamed protein product [Amoebophrya sp. A120]|eukprot:GSA120T00003580001.1
MARPAVRRPSSTAAPIRRAAVAVGFSTRPRGGARGTVIAPAPGICPRCNSCCRRPSTAARRCTTEETFRRASNSTSRWAGPLSPCTRATPPRRTSRPPKSAC